MESPDKRPADLAVEDGGDAQANKRPRLDTSSLANELATELPVLPTSVAVGGSTIDVEGLGIPADSALFTKIKIPEPVELSPQALMKANLSSLRLTLQSDNALPIRVQFAINSIPLLDNVATQVLRLIGVAPYEDTLGIITNEETPEGLVYRDLVTLFEHTKKIYSEDDPFLDLKHIVEDPHSLKTDESNSLKEVEESVEAALKKANLATFLLATLGSIDVGFYFLNESFLDVFCPSTSSSWFKNNRNGAPYHAVAGKLLKAQAGLFLELKTQAYISAFEAGERSKEEILDDIFPGNLDVVLLSRRNSTQLTPAEMDFISRCQSRRESLLEAPEDEDLGSSYDWMIFLKELFNYVSKNIGSLLWGRKGRNSFLARFDISHHTDSLPLSEAQKRLDTINQEEAERERNQQETSPVLKVGKSATSVNGSSSAGGTTPVAGPSSSSSSAPPRLRNITRRPWNAIEEAALITALKEYGPHWAKILEFYGPGGKVNEDLKGRTQVQLKDKARNWKVSHLKNGNPVPEYLQKVTGELDRDERVASARRRQRQKGNLQKQGKRPVTKNESADSKEGTAEVQEGVAEKTTDVAREAEKENVPASGENQPQPQPQ